MTFDNLISNVEHVHDITSSYAKGAVNQLLTVRNWMIGYYIVEYEQHGQNRADYGTNLLENIASRINIKGLDRTHLNLCRVFYLKYPQISATVSHKLQGIGEIGFLPTETIADETHDTENIEEEISATVLHKFETPPETLISRLSFSHIREIMSIDDPFERFFYEFECIKGIWSVRELRRQIASNLYFRAGISKNPEQLLEQLVNSDYNAIFNIKEPMALEFLGIDARESVTESDLEQALKDHLQEFLLCTKKGKKMVEYALSGMDNKLFVSQYMLQLPDKKELEKFMISQLNELGLEQ